MGIALQLLPLVINLIVAQFFFVTLKQGNTPLITAIARIEQGGSLTSELTAYTRRLTFIWGGFLVTLALVHLLAGRLLDAHLHPALQWLMDPVAILCFMAVEFGWRVRRFPGCRFETPWKIWGLIRRNGGMYRLYRQCIT